MGGFCYEKDCNTMVALFFIFGIVGCRSSHIPHEKRPMYAFVVDGNIVGYYSLALQENKECELNNLCVLPQFRHKGIGEKLLFHSFQTARDL